MKHPNGCLRCRLDLIRFNRTISLPRFQMAAGEEWRLPQIRYTSDGGAEIGGGIAPADSFTVVERDHARACHNGKPCAG